MADNIPVGDENLIAAEASAASEGDIPEVPLPEEPIFVEWWTEEGVTPPRICNVRADTREFTSVGEADPSPLEPGVWLYAANSYRVDPPEYREGHVAVINAEGNGWNYVEDYRGKIVYNTETKETLQWGALGPLPEGYTDQIPPDPNDKWEDDKWVPDEAYLEQQRKVKAYRRKSLSTSYATIQISTLQDAVDEEMATAQEEADLKAWKRFRIELNRIDLEVEVPADDAWPVSPKEAALQRWMSLQP